MSPKKFLLVIILIVGAAAGGYYYGLYKTSSAQEQVTLLKKELAQAQFRLKLLVEVKQRLNQAQMEIAQKNFGRAQKEVEAVQSIIADLQAKAEPTQKKKLEELNPAVKKIITGLSALDFATVSQIEELKVSLEQIALLGAGDVKSP